VKSRFDAAAYQALWQRDLPRPIDVPNLIDPQPGTRAYAAYGLLVTPVLMLIGTKILWAGRHEHALAGEPQAGELLIVRYRSHRRFLGMVASPYYQLINRLRERAVARFQAGFADARGTGADLPRTKTIAALHLPASAPADGEDRVAQALDARIVYRAEQVAPLDFVRGRKPSDPQPMALPRIALLETTPAASIDAAELPDGASLQLYRRQSRRELLGAR
jgi:uncharacterized protein (DUF1330 family)